MGRTYWVVHKLNMPTTDAYLLRKYGITVAERQAIVDEQGGKCAACGRPFDGTVRMEVDHEHFKVRCVSAKNSVFNNIGLHKFGWYAYTQFIRMPCWAKTKAVAIAAAKKASLRGSVRGVLCGGRYAGCNRKIGRIDKVPWLRAVTQYLQDPPARKVLQKH